MMWMWLLVGILVVAAIITKLKRSKRIVLMKLYERANMSEMSEETISPKASSTSATEHMICCDQCGIYIPDSEALSRGGKVFCCKEHSIQFFSS